MNTESVKESVYEELHLFLWNGEVKDLHKDSLSILTFLYLYSKNEIKLIKIKDADIKKYDKSIMIFLYKELNKEEISATETVDYDNGVRYYAFAATTVSNNPLYSIIQEVYNQKEYKEWLNFDNFHSIYKILCKYPIEQVKSQLKVYTRLTLEFYHETFGNCKRFNLQTNFLACRLMNLIISLYTESTPQKNEIIHPWSVDWYYLHSLPEGSHYAVAYDDAGMNGNLWKTVAEIYGINGKLYPCTGGEYTLPKGLENGTADCILVDNINLPRDILWRTILKTAEKKMHGIFLVKNDLLLQWGKEKNFNSEETGKYIFENLISHVYFLPYNLAILIIPRDRTDTSDIVYMNETANMLLDRNKIIEHEKNRTGGFYHKFITEKIIKQKNVFDLSYILGVKNRIKTSKEENSIAIKKIVKYTTEYLEDEFGRKQDSKYILNDIFCNDYSKFLPYYYFGNGHLFRTTEEKSKTYHKHFLVVDFKNRRTYQPKILLLKSLNLGEDISFGKSIAVFRIINNTIDINYLINEINKKYFIDQFFTTETDVASRSDFVSRIKAFYNCSIILPDTLDSTTPLKRQRIFLNKDLLEHIHELQLAHGYNIDDIKMDDKLPVDTTLKDGRYIIIEQLEAGGFGITYKAKDTVNNCIVAIKEFFDKELHHRDSESNSVITPIGEKMKAVWDVRKKFFTEASKIKGFDCENIVKIHEVFDEHDTSYYSMEYIDGDNLHNHVMKMKKLDEGEAIRIIKGVANALKRMHCDRMLHMDVKPKNIMISKEGRVVLIDFGGAHKYNTSPHDNSTLARIGSPGFTPPEPVSSVRFSPAYDIYSLGATLYYMLTGIVYNIHSEYSQQGNNKNIHPMQYLHMNNISEETNKCIEKSLEYLPSYRQQSIDEFLAMLPYE